MISSVIKRKDHALNSMTSFFSLLYLQALFIMCLTASLPQLPKNLYRHIWLGGNASIRKTSS